MKRLWTITASIVFALLLAATLGPVLVVLSLRWVDPPTTAVILARSWERLWEGKEPVYPYRKVVPLASISPHLRRAVVASEDGRFYLHNGFDVREIADSLESFDRGEPLRGASTITQQTAKNLFLWEGRSLARKALEAYLTALLEHLLSKDRILEIYLNLAEWGDGIFGAEAAAIGHFGKPASGLTRSEAARLAVILPSPRRWRVRGPWVGARAQEIMARMGDVPGPAS